jgi:hypothetical protein
MVMIVVKTVIQPIHISDLSHQQESLLTPWRPCQRSTKLWVSASIPAWWSSWSAPRHSVEKNGAWKRDPVKSEVVRGVEQQPRWYHILIIHMLIICTVHILIMHIFSLYHSDYTYSCLYIYIHQIYIYTLSYFFYTYTHIYIIYIYIYLLMDKL